jgi:hypothetical protein
MMRKIIFFAILFLFNILAVKAEDLTWYEEEQNDSKLELVNTERRYKWYTENIVYSNDYFIEGQNPSEYPYKVDSDHIETDFSVWNHEIVPEYMPGRIIESSMNYYPPY